MTASAAGTLGAVVIPTPAKALPALVAFQAASAVLGIVGAFSKSDGGMGALLAANYHLSQLIAQQLTVISSQLSQLQQQVLQLPDELRRALVRQAQDMFVTAIISDAQIFSNFLQAARMDPRIWTRPAELGQLRAIDQDLLSNRTKLENYSQGFGPDAAMIVPVACSLEVAIKPRIGFSNAIVRQTLISYQRWVARILGTERGSIDEYLHAAAASHDSVADEAARSNQLANHMGIQRFKVAGNQQSDGSDWCVIVSGSPHFTGGPTTSPATALAHARNLPGFGVRILDKTIHTQRYGYLYFEGGRIIAADNSEMKFKELSYQRDGLGKIVPPDGPPVDGAICHYDRKDPGLTQPTSSVLPNIVSIARQGAARAAEDSHRASLTASLEMMNFHRARMAYALEARRVATQSEQLINRWLGAYAA